MQAEYEKSRRIMRKKYTEAVMLKAELARAQVRMDQDAHDIRLLKKNMETCTTTMNEAVAKMWVKEKELEAKTTEAKALQRNYDNLREELIKTQRSRYEKQQRIHQLEKLLVHNGKAIGALTELAADKYKHDDLPF